MKLACDAERMEALAMGELGADEERAARAHAEVCDGCARELRLLERERRAIVAFGRARAGVGAGAGAGVSAGVSGGLGIASEAEIARVIARAQVRRAAAGVRRATWGAAAVAVAALLVVRAHVVSAASDGRPSGATSVASWTRDSTADERAVVAADEAWSACMTMTPAAAPPAPMSIDDGTRVTGARFSALPREACE